MHAQGKNEPAKDRRARRCASCPFWWTFLACGCCLVALGCAGDIRRPGGDPLFGGAPPLPNGSKAPPPANQSAAAGPLPALPAPNATASTAALASGPAAPVDGRHDLQIGDSRPQPPGQTWSGPPAAGNTVLQPPQPALIPTASQSVAPAFAPASTARLTSYEQARGQLQARNVAWFRLETGDQGSYKFSCSIPNRQNPNLSRTYEAQGPTELAAIQVVLEQIDKER
jgi:hypothetical protein